MNDSSSVSQYDVIRQLRFPMIVLVTYAHSYGGIADSFNLLSSDWNTYEFLKLLVSQTLVKVTVPVFFIMSGYLFFANVEPWNMQVFQLKIRRRIKTLLIPYLVWNLLMVLKLKAFSMSFFWEPANMPLWFLRDLILVSLLTPIIFVAVKRFGWWILVLLFPIYMTGIWAIQPDVNPYGICFFTIGAILSIKKLDLVGTCKRFEIPAYLLASMSCVGMLLSHGSQMFMPLMLVFRLSGAFAVFCLASRCTQRWPSYDQSPLCSLLAKSSYFIYLAHYVFFFSFIDSLFFSFFGTSTLSLSLHYLLCPLVKSAIFVGIYFLYQKYGGLKNSK